MLDSYNVDTYSGPSFSLKNRIVRAVWNISCFFLFTYTLFFMHSWRVFILRLFGAEIGKNVHIYPKAKIWAPWNLKVGDQSGIANHSILYSQGKITIGKRVVISQGTHICAGTHDYTKKGHPLITKPIVIGDNAWVAAEAFIHPGVTIGEGVVIGARSVVTKDMPAWMVCAGHPCKPIKERVIKD